MTRSARTFVGVSAIAALLAVVTPAAANHGAPAEPDFHCQWSLRNAGQSAYGCQDTGVRKPGDLMAPEAWALAASLGTVRPAVVAVSEHGIDITHPDLADQLWVNPGEDGLDANGNDRRSNGIDDDMNGYVDDVHGWNFDNNSNVLTSGEHGTQVASIALADSDNGIGMAGIAGFDGQAKLMVLIRPRAGFSNASTYIPLFDYARNNGADVLNMSHGAPGTQTREELAWTESATIAAARRLTEAGVVLALAGNMANLGTEADGWDFYDFPGALRVHGSNYEGKRAYGNEPNLAKHRFDIAAPSTAIYAAIPGGGYGWMATATSGSTSGATPHVSGTAALIKSVYPQLHGHKIAQAMMESVDLDPTFTYTNKSGGRLNAYKALVRAGQLAASN